MGWPLFTEDLAITASLVGSPPPSSGSREESTHTAQRQHSMTISTEPGAHTHTQPGREAVGGIWERYTGNAGEHCVSISLFRNANSFPQPSCLYPVPRAACWPAERVHLTGLVGPAAQTRCGCARATGLKWQQHLYSLASKPWSLTFMCFWLFCRPLLSLLLTQDWKQVNNLCIQGEIICFHNKIKVIVACDGLVLLSGFLMTGKHCMKSAWHSKAQLGLILLLMRIPSGSSLASSHETTTNMLSNSAPVLLRPYSCKAD